MVDASQNFQRLQDALRSIPKFGEGTGLHRMLSLCQPMAEWMNDLDAIKVTGSNGKGSVSAMVAGILAELGYSTGLYTSPHLLEFNERIVNDGRPISNSELTEAVKWFYQRKDEYQGLFPGDTIGAFEAFTAMALHHFSRKRPRALVIEAGIGGRYDSTRIIPGKVVGLTSLDLEHTTLLGNTLELIAYDKADLCPDGGTIVTGVTDPDLLRRLTAYCALRRVTVLCADEHSSISGVSFGETHMKLNLELDGVSVPELRVALQGFHQATNVRVAALLVKEWIKIHQPTLPQAQFEDAIRRGMESLRWPGRFERIRQNPDVYIDVGHSPGAIDSLVATIRSAMRDRRILLVTGVSYDKEVESIVKRLLTIADAVICTQAHHKGSPAEKILRIAGNTKPDIPAFMDPDITEATRHAVEYASSNNMTVVIAGGLFLSIEAAEALSGRPPQDLHFF